MGGQSGKSSADGLSDQARRHFMSPSNVGSIAEADAVARRENAVCGDAMVLYLKTDEERIADARFKTFGCSSSIAASSALTEALIGKTLAEARVLSRAELETALGGLSNYQGHSLDLVLDTLSDALAQLG